MTGSEPHRLSRRLALRAVQPLRRAIAPGALELPSVAAEVRQLRSDLAHAEQRAERAEARVESLEQRLSEQSERVDRAGDGVRALEQRLDEFQAWVRGDLQESRRLNIRVAELTDVVTELVLPLHDRELQPEAIRALRPEPL